MHATTAMRDTEYNPPNFLPAPDPKTIIQPIRQRQRPFPSSLDASTLLLVRLCRYGDLWYRSCRETRGFVKKYGDIDSARAMPGCADHAMTGIASSVVFLPDPLTRI